MQTEIKLKINYTIDGEMKPGIKVNDYFYKLIEDAFGTVIIVDEDAAILIDGLEVDCNE